MVATTKTIEKDCLNALKECTSPVLLHHNENIKWYILTNDKDSMINISLSKSDMIN